MKKREKILAGATGVLLTAFAGAFLFTGRGDSLGDLRTQRDKLSKTVDTLKAKAGLGDKASEQLDRWRKRSLPKNDKVAALYNNWLSDLAIDRIKLTRTKITPMSGQDHRGIYTTLPFRIEGQGTLDQVTRFLHEFESVGYLHKVQLLTFTPNQGSQEGKVVMTVEALCLPNAEHKDKLPAGSSTRLKHSKLDEYLKMIIRRKMEGDRYVDNGGLFASYAPPSPPRGPDGPPPPPPPSPPAFDPSSVTYVNGIHAVDGLPEVWLFVRTEGKTLKLHEGDPFEVGSMHGTIARIRIDELDVEIEVDGRRQLVAFGKNLRDGVEPPD